MSKPFQVARRCALGTVCLLVAQQVAIALGDAAAPATLPAGEGRYGAEVSRLVNEKDEIVSVLANGVTVIAKRIDSPVVSVRGYVHAGGVYEGKWLGAGLSHLLEHLVAGGSNQRRTEAENRDLLQQIGNNSNAYTLPDHTAYFVNTTAPNMDKAVDLVTGWMLTARITPAEFEREREVVQRELEKDKGEPDWAFYNQTLRNRYRISPARVPTIGYQAVIQRITRDDVWAYYKLGYRPNNMVFAVGGNLDPEVMLKSVQKHVSEFPPGEAFHFDIAAEPEVTAPRTLVATFPKLGQAKLELGFPSIRLQDPDLYALDLLAAVLGHGESSILVEELRDRQQLVSTISASSFTPDYVAGTFSIDMEVAPDKIPAATAAVLAQIEKIKREGVDEDRLHAAKTQIKTARAFEKQTSENVVQSMATDFLSTGDPHFSDRYAERMQNVTVDQIKAVVAKYLDRQRLLTTALLPQVGASPSGLAAAENLLRAAAPTTRPAGAGEASQVVRLELNGNITLLLKRVSTAPVVTVQMYSLGGLTAEDAQTNGLGNLAMHLVSRGTKHHSAQQIAEFFDSIGGDLSTSCGNNTWSWSAACVKEDLPRTLEVFADVVQNPTFPDSETGMMKKRIIAAIESQDADWFAQSMRFFRRTYFGPRNEPYQFVVLGTKENVDRFTPEQVRQWYAQKVLAGRRVLAIYGDIDVNKARELAQTAFGAAHQSGQNVATAQQAAGELRPGDGEGKPSITVKQVAIQKTDNPQAGIIIGFNSNSVVGSPENYPLTVAKTMASGYGYPTGYLFEVLRGEGLVYDVQSVIFPGRSTQLPGTFIAYAGCEPKNVNKVVDLMLENIARLQGKAQDVQPQWFERSRKLIVTSDAMENETAAQQAMTAALDELFGLGHDYHAKFAGRIEAVTLPEVQAAARSLLRDCVVTINTSAPEAVTVKEGRRVYESFPPVNLTPRGVQHDTGGAGTK